MEYYQWWIKIKLWCNKWNYLLYRNFKINLCDYNDAYILLSGNITVVAAPIRQVAFKTCAPFTKCIPKTDKTTIDDAEGLV